MAITPKRKFEYLRDLSLGVAYSSDKDNIVSDFYIPCMQCSTLYRRAVGYFTSHGLAYAARGVSALLLNGGRIQLVASPILSEEDTAALQKGYENRTKLIAAIASRNFTEVTSRLEGDHLNALAWLVQDGALDVRLAIRVDSEKRLTRGIFHEKMGIFTDAVGDSVAFSGSANETQGGLIENFEAIDVFWSWDDPANRVQQKIARFESFWNNNTKGLEVIDFTEATTELLSRYKQPSRPRTESYAVRDEEWQDDGYPRIPSAVKLRDYQEQGIRNWFKNNGRGTFKMATGSGKTITALGLATKLYEKFALQALIIVCPYRHLVAQWANECQQFGLNPILAFESRKKWEPLFASGLYGLSVGTTGFVCVITTNSTFSSEAFQQKLAHCPQKTLLIADEVHNLGAKKLRKRLPESVPFRLGLSATPERWFDDKGTEALFDYFGPILEPQVTLADALKKGVLSPYRYYPILVELTDDERDQYLELSSKIGKALSGADLNEDDPILTALLVRRARLIGSAKGKLDALRSLMKNRLDAKHMLFYCGDGTVEDPVSEEEERQVEAVLKLLGYELGIRVAPYTAETPLEERKGLSRALDIGEVQGLVAIRCLDEGVDIPSITTAFILASSRNPRQFIQRRGRILRRASGKESAEIFDMIVVPPSEATTSDSERNLLQNELIRFAEFADLALNGGEARAVIFDLQKRFDLTDI